MIDDWSARLRAARDALAPAAALLGRWEGDGIAHGDPVHATMEARATLDGTMIEVRERVGDHEDVSYYRWDLDTRQIRVLHLMAGPVVEDHAVELTPDGLVWVTPPDSPAVVWAVEGDGLRCDVVWPGQRLPEVRVRYRRA